MPQRTLYEDWQLRRERFNTHEPLPHYTEQAKVFDYLLSRYDDDPAAQQPAKFPLRSEVYLNSRAIIVHHHVKCGEFGATQSKEDAHVKARTVLRRIAAEDPQANIGTPSSHINWLPPEGPGVPLSALAPPALFENSAGFLKCCKAILLEGGALHFREVERLKSLLSKNLFGDQVDASLSDVLDVIDVCPHPDLIRYLYEHWRQFKYVSSESRSCIAAFLKRKERGAELARLELASDKTYERIQAAEALGEMGALDDIGLLQDLLALPEMTEDSEERWMYLNAMNQLAGVNTKAGEKPKRRTLYEDWQLRRERLNDAEPLPHFEDQAKVLDYLLSRYKDDPVAHEPARFPLID